MGDIYKYIDNSLYISKDFITDNGLSKSELKKHFKNFTSGKSAEYANVFSKKTNTTWIEFNTIPRKVLIDLSLPLNTDSFKRIASDLNFKIIEKHKSRVVEFHLQQAFRLEYIPYKDYYFDVVIRNLYAKSHAVINKKER